MRTLHFSENFYSSIKAEEPQFWAVCGRQRGNFYSSIKTVGS